MQVAWKEKIQAAIFSNGSGTPLEPVTTAVSWQQPDAADGVMPHWMVRTSRDWAIRRQAALSFVFSKSRRFTDCKGRGGGCFCMLSPLKRQSVPLEREAHRRIQEQEMALGESLWGISTHCAEMWLDSFCETPKRKEKKTKRSVGEPAEGSLPNPKKKQPSLCEHPLAARKKSLGGPCAPE